MAKGLQEQHAALSGLCGPTSLCCANCGAVLSCSEMRAGSAVRLAATALLEHRAGGMEVVKGVEHKWLRELGLFSLGKEAGGELTPVNNVLRGGGEVGMGLCLQ